MTKENEKIVFKLFLNNLIEPSEYEEIKFDKNEENLILKYLHDFSSLKCFIEKTDILKTIRKIAIEKGNLEIFNLENDFLSLEMFLDKFYNLNKQGIFNHYILLGIPSFETMVFIISKYCYYNIKNSNINIVNNNYFNNMSNNLDKLLKLYKDESNKDKYEDIIKDIKLKMLYTISCNEKDKKTGH